MINTLKFKLLVMLPFMLSGVFAHSIEKQITLRNVDVREFNDFLNRWSVFEKAISAYWQSEKDFFSDCDIKRLSVNAINGFWKYDLDEAQKLIWDHPKILSELSVGGEELFAVNTKNPCPLNLSNKNISWFFVSQPDGYKVFNDVILIKD